MNLLSLRGNVWIPVRSIRLDVWFGSFSPDLLRNLIVLPRFRRDLHWINRINWVAGNHRCGSFRLEFNGTLLRTVRYHGLKVSNHLEVLSPVRVDLDYPETLFVWSVRNSLNIIGISILDK